MLRRVAMLAACLAATGASAAPAKQDFDQGPDWIRKPDPNKLKAVWPTAAVQKGVGGKALLQCKVTTAGTLSACRVAEEKPAGLGFGAAALLLAPSFLMRPAIKNGQPVESSVTIPVNWEGVSLPPDSIRSASRRMPLSVIWDETPGAEDLARAWPARAGDVGYGHVVLRCGVAPDGALKSCSKISEVPVGQGFYDAARTLVPSFRMRTTGLDPKTVKQIDLNLPIHFVNPGAAKAERMLPKPEWTRQFAPDKAAGQFPPKAAAAGLKTGRATVECAIERSGELDQCRVVDETPAGMDFGPAAVALASALAVNPWTFEGLPAEGAKVRIAIRINSNDPEPGAKPSGG